MRNENVLEIVSDVLAKIDMPNAEVMKAHRTGKGIVRNGQTLPRQIIFKLLRHSDKQYAMQNQREKLSDVPYYLVDDLTDMDLQTKKSYKEVIDQAKTDHKKWKFRNGKVVIDHVDGKVYSE